MKRPRGNTHWEEENYSHAKNVRRFSLSRSENAQLNLSVENGFQRQRWCILHKQISSGWRRQTPDTEGKFECNERYEGQTLTAEIKIIREYEEEINQARPKATEE